jgi:hypothetical protein
MKINTFKIRTLVVIALSLVSIVGKTQYFVDPQKGNDRNAGTISAPFQTVEKARDVIRSQKQLMQKDIIVYLRNGRYNLDTTIEFTEADGGRNGHQVIYQAYKDEKPVFEAGIAVTGWSKTEKGIWKAKNIAVDNFRQLYVNGTRANRARSSVKYTGSGWPQPYVSFTDDDWLLKKQFHPDGIKVSSTALQSGWKNHRDMELVWIGKESNCTWRSHRILVNALIAEGKDSTIIKLDNYGFPLTGASMSRPLPENPFYLENALELLDEPGEWYYDRPAKELYYLPRPNEDLPNAQVFIPSTVETILSIKGSKLNKKVKNLIFKGITFQHTSWLRPSSSRVGACSGQADRYINGHGQIGRAHKAIDRREFFFDPAFDFVLDANGEAEGFKPDACIELDAAENIQIVNCTFQHLGGVGIDLMQGCNNINISNNSFTDLSATSIVIGRWDQDYIGENEEVCKDVKITNNYIHKTGQEYYNSPGITAFFTDNLLIAHNDIVDVPYSGISSGWGAWKGKTAWTTSNRRNVIEYNYIQNICQKCSDGGGIYTIGIGKSRTDPDTLTSKIRYNFIKDTGYAYGGLYPDEGSCYYEIINNVVENVEGYEKGKWLHLWSVNHHNIKVDRNFSNSSKYINKGILCPLTNHTLYSEQNRPQAALDIIKKAGRTVKNNPN